MSRERSNLALPAVIEFLPFYKLAGDTFRSRDRGHNRDGEEMETYRYPHFQRELLMEDMIFRRGPGPGELMPDFKLPTIDGGQIRKSDFIGQRPVLLTFGSITCPMTAASSGIIKKLHREFGDRIEFVTLYVREAHPGENYPQAQTFEQKLEHARDYETRDDIPWTIAVDDLEGSLHRQLDPKPNAAYIISRTGRVAYRSLWSNDAGALRAGLKEVAENPDAIVGQTQSHMVPMLSGMGTMRDTVGQSGPTAKRDLIRQAPPMYAMASLAAVFRPLSPLQRGLASIALTGLGIYGITRLIQRFR